MALVSGTHHNDTLARRKRDEEYSFDNKPKEAKKYQRIRQGELCQM